MRSRTSSSNKTVLKKDLSRFAPVWVEYGVLLVIMTYIFYGEGALYFNLDGTVVLFSAINLVYGFVCAMSVFGYLHDSVECNMVHAFPIRRETYFLLHLSAGYMMGLVPNLLFAAANLPLAGEDVLFLFFSIMLQFTFFYGLSVLCMFLTGRKLGALTLYTLLNFLPVLLRWAVDTLYLPQLPGVWLDEEAFYRCYPLYRFMSYNGTMEQRLATFGWFALAGVVSGAAGFLLYRKRKLEYAGDLMAVKGMIPVFLFCLSFACGCVVASLGETMFGVNVNTMLVIGLLTGYFTGLMLMHKTVKVFQPKRLAGALAVVAVVLGSVLVTGLDPLGRVYYIPDAEQIEFVSVGYYDSEFSDAYETTDPEVIRDLLVLHQELLDQDNFARDYYGAGNSAFIRYELSSGKTIKRWYNATDTDAWKHLNYYYSQPQMLLDVSSFEEFQEKLERCELSVYGSASEIHRELQGEELEKMMELFYREATEGVMAEGYVGQKYPSISLIWEMAGKDYYGTVNIPTTAEDTHAYCMELWDKYRN